MNIEQLTFTQEQKHQIELGRKAGLDVSVYAKPELLAIQMHEIRLGLEQGLPVQHYASAQYDWFQMEEIRKGLERKVDITRYADPAIPFDVMRQIRKGLENGFDLSGAKRYPAGALRQLRIAACEKIDIRKYIREGYDEEQLMQIRIAKEKRLNLDPYLSLTLRGPSIREIVLGLENGVDVSVYADTGMNWQQMREIRLGLEKCLDVSLYRNTLYSWQQMREIRLGIEMSVPVEHYLSLMYTAKEMKNIRLDLLAENPVEYKNGHEEQEQYKNFMLLINADWMEAYILLTDENAVLGREQILSALKEKGVVSGIKEDAIKELGNGEPHPGMITIATGEMPEEGKDGWYEYFFETEIKKMPKILEDGTADYQDVKWFEVVKKGQKVIYYHGATEGKKGRRINGELIHGVKGRELLPLQGKGIMLLPDHRTYVAATDGRIELKDGKVEVTNIMVLDEVSKMTGNVEFNGSVCVQGMVRDGAVIRASGDIVVDGFTEAAVLEAGGNIILRKGNNPRNRGHIHAGKNVMGSFFENAKVMAGEDVKANYCMNSKVTAERDIIITGKMGKVVGGITQAGMNLEVYDLGNSAGLRTEVYVGREDKYINDKNQLALQMKSVGKELSLLRSAYQNFQKRFTPEERNINPMYLKIEDAIYTKELELKSIREKDEYLEQKIDKSRRAKMIVKGTIYQGTKVDVNGAKWNSNLVTNVTLRKKDERISIYKNS